MLPRGLLKEYFRTLTFALRGLDALAIVCAGLAAYFYRFGHLHLPQRYVTALAIAAGLTLLVFQFFRIYESIRAQSFWQHIRKVSRAVFVVLAMLVGLAFLSKTGQEYSRIWFISWSIFSFVLLLFFRGSLLTLLRLMRSYGMNEKGVVMIGADETGRKLAGTMHQAMWTGFRILAIFDDQPEGKPDICGIRIEKTPADLNAYIQSHKNKIDEIWLALPLRAEDRVREILHAIRHHTIAIRYVLNLFGLGLLKHTVTDMDGFPMVNLNSSPMVGLNRLVKAVEDRLAAAFILIFISPVLLLIALGVKCTSKGPVFFKQLRHGWDGRIIKVYKFRTMIQHEEAAGQVTQATVGDHRITWFGKLLRKTSLDELPQFFNVLQGRMSIVGPRPHALAHNEFYKDSINAYMQRHKVKPGITGWAQVNGWRGETDTLEKMQKRVEYDLYYIENWSLLFDLKIIFLTLIQGFISKNAY